MKNLLIIFLLITLTFYSKAGDDFKLLSLGNGTQFSGISSGNYLGSPIKFNNDLLFCRYDENTGYELWISDGTSSGTKLLKDIVAGHESSYPFDFVTMGSEMVFTIARKEEATSKLVYELWKTDGTESGTKFIEKAFTWEFFVAPNSPSYQKRFFLVGNFQDKIIYKYNNDNSPTSGWHTIALNFTSQLIENFPLNSTTFKIEDGIQVGNKFLFSNIIAHDPFARKAHQYYITDGTENGTELLKNGNAPIFNKHENQHNFNADYIWANYTWNDNFYFYGTDSNDVSAIFRVNPSNNQLEKVLTIMNNSFANEEGLTAVKFATANYKLIIHLLFKKHKYDNLSLEDSSATFISDGTLGGTSKLEILNNKIRLLIDKLPNDAFLYKDFENNIKAFNFSNNSFGETVDAFQPNDWNDNYFANKSNQYFVKNNYCYILRGNNIIKTNGTISGTSKVAELNVGYSNLAISWFAFDINNKLFFMVKDDYKEIQNLWFINLANDQLSTLGNYELKYYPALNPYINFESENYVTYQNKSYFSGFNDDGQIAWKTEGTPATTLPIGKKLSGQAPFINQHFGWYGAYDKMYYGTYDDLLSLYVTDGNGTIKLDSFPPDIPFGISRFYQFNNEVYFVANDKTICKTNGTKAGTKRLKTIVGMGVIGDFFEINGSLFIPALGNNKEFIWKINADGTLTPIIKWNTLPFTFNTGQVVTFFGVINGKNVFEVCDEISEKTGEHLGKHYLLAFDGTKTYFLTNTSLTNAFKNKYAYFNNFVINDNKLFFTTIGLSDGTKPIANFNNIGKDFTEDGYLFYTQGLEGDLIQAKVFPEFQANIQCTEALGIISIGTNMVQLKSKNNQIYTCLYNALYPRSFDDNLRSIFLLNNNFEFEKVLDLEDEIDNMILGISKIFFSENGNIYGLKTFIDQDYSEMKTVVSSCDGLSINSEIKYDTIISKEPSFFYGIMDENIGIYDGKFYFLIKPVGLNQNGEERMGEVNITTKTSRVVPKPADILKINDINFNRNDGILVTAYYKPSQPERPGTSLWLYNNITTGISNHSLQKQISLFPNPTNNFITINIPKDFIAKKIEIYNLNGGLIQIIKLESNENTKTIDVSNFPTGTYLVRIKNDTQSLTGKFIKIE